MVTKLPQVDEEQLTYLQNLIFVSGDDVEKAFAVYRRDQDAVRLAETLKKVMLPVFWCHWRLQ